MSWSLLMATYPIFTLESQAYTVQRMSFSRTSISVIKCKMLLRMIAEVKGGRILLEEKEISQDQVSKKKPCKKLILCQSCFCLASHF